MEHHREESSSSSRGGFQTNSPPAPATYMPREGDWVLVKAPSSDPSDQTTPPPRIFQLLESATKPDHATPLRARRYLRPSELPLHKSTDGMLFEGDAVLQTSIGTVQPAHITGRAIVVHWDDREKAAELRNALPNPTSIPIFTCKRYATQAGSVTFKTPRAFEQLLAPNTRTLEFKPPKVKKIKTKVEPETSEIKEEQEQPATPRTKVEAWKDDVYVEHELKEEEEQQQQSSNKRPASAEPAVASPVLEKRARVDVLDVHVWLTTTFEIRDPPAGQSWTSTPLWKLHRSHASTLPNIDAFFLNEKDLYECVESWCPGRIKFYDDGVAVNLRPRTPPLDPDVVRWLHETYERNLNSFVFFKDVQHEFARANPTAGVPLSQVSVHFLLFLQHMQTYAYHATNESGTQDGVVVTGIGRRRTLAPLPPLPPLLLPTQLPQSRSDSTPPNTYVQSPDNVVKMDDDNESPLEYFSPDSDRKPSLDAAPPKSQLSLQEFLDHMKVVDPDRASSYDDALPILARELVACDVLALVGAAKMEEMGIKIGAAHRI
ncbi:hypothetical protein RQP46_000690 [Phenoliferia psychrophenolica]